MTKDQLNAAAKVLAECMDYPWEHMPEPGRQKMREHAAAVIAAAQPAAPAVVEWMPIETAPKDGTDVLVMYMHIDTQIVHNAFWIGDDDCGNGNELGWWSYIRSEVSRELLDDSRTPTHWMPLPTPPEGAQR